MRRKNKDLGMRTLINGCSAILIALFILLAHYTALRWLFTTAVASIAAVAVWEYCQILKKKELFPAVYLSMAAVVIYVFVVFIKTERSAMNSTILSYGPEIILGVTFFSCFIHYTLVNRPPIINIATTFFGMVYIGIPLALLVSIIYYFKIDPYLEGSWWIIYLIAVTKSADIGGYFLGSYFGKRRLASKLSPNKTLEGAIGGLLIAILMSLWICFLGKEYGHIFKNFSYAASFWLGLTIGVLGQIGDLAESFLKRDAHIKDSNSIPGVGGILDMIDSLLFTTPTVYLFLRMIYPVNL